MVNNNPIDESLHSFLLRKQFILSEKFNPVGVISKLGGWTNYPFVHKEAEHIFSKYDDHFLLEILDENKIIDGFGNQLFNSPIAYASRIKSTFFPNRKSTGIKKTLSNIKFCNVCVQEAIKEHGFAYLKISWLKNDFCEKHNEPLKVLPYSNYKAGVKSIVDILKGKVPKIAVNTCIHRSYSKELSANDITKSFFQPVKATYCLALEFAAWLLNNANELSDDFYQLVASDLLEENCLMFLNDNITLYYGQRNISEYESLKFFEKISLILKATDNQLICRFVNEYISLVKIQLGPRKQGVLTEIVSVANKRKCDNCKWKGRCAVSDDAEELLTQDVNIEYLFANSHSLVRLATQDLLIAFTGDDVWSPIKINREGITKKALKMQK